MTAWEEFFGDRAWRIAEEVNGVVEVDPSAGVSVSFSRGRFAVSGTGVFQSPFSSNKGKRGVLLQELDTSRERDIPGSYVVVGDTLLSRARSSGALSPGVRADLA